MLSKERIKTLVRISRAPFFTAVIFPALVGGAVAANDGTFSVGLLVATVIGIVFVNAGLNLSNDYFDHVSGNDASNETPTPFSGGSRSIQDGLVTPKQVLLWSLLCYAIAIVIGLYLTTMRGWPVLAFGAFGIFLAFFHNAPPVNLYGIAPGVGELASGIGCGPLIVMGSYYVQTQHHSWEAFWLSVVLGLLVIGILYINEFPDRLADASVGKKTVPVVLGPERAVWGYVALIAAAYLVILGGVIAGVLPALVLIVFVTLPLALKAVRGALQSYADIPALIPAMATTIQLHVAVSVLMCVAYVIAILL